jgi:peptidoglycan/xylan/chitin deacetylase (PgdA/CDA1 family)
LVSAEDEPGDGRRRALVKRALVIGLGLVTLGWSDEVARDVVISGRNVDLAHPAWVGPRRPPVRGAGFPDGVLALTWDDGPDVETLALARYLRQAKVSATFFVVGEWVDGLSDEPGTGANVYRTGYAHLPVLGDLVALGHRLGSHTENHVLLADAPTATVADQLMRSSHAIAPYLTNELRMFRAPGGAWSREAASATTDPLLTNMLGPFHWEIDAKDWDASLYCRSSPPSDCERGPIAGGMRVRPSVIAHRYLAQIEHTRRGIVLLHDRVGDVGSRYALDVARSLIPEIEARGFVLAGPVLEFSPLTDRGVLHVANGSSVVVVDVDGDAKGDLCQTDAGSITCAHAATRRSSTAIPQIAFEAPRPLLPVPVGARATDLADVDADGRADLCVFTGEAIECAVSTRGPALAQFERWRSDLGRMKGGATSFRLADVDGDGRADACVRSESAIVCAMSTGRSFGAPRVWRETTSLDDGSRLALADVDGDQRADVCEKTRFGVACALSNGHAFLPAVRWSLDGDFEGTGPVQLGDLNGDGRADACAPSREGVLCALSGRHRFKQATLWSSTRSGEIRLADLNGDGRADLCAIASERVECGLAP